MKSKLHISYTNRRKIDGFIFSLPFLCGFFMFFAIPLINTFIYSFNLISVNEQGGMVFTPNGIQNYVDLFTSEVTTDAKTFAQLFSEECIELLVNVPLITIFSLFMALLANREFKGRNLVRVIFFLPIILGISVVNDALTITTGSSDASAAVSMSGALFSGSNFFEYLFSYTSIPNNIIVAIESYVDNVFSLISQAGVQTLLYLTALQSINPSLYEVAKIEGATAYETFWKVTIPSIFRITVFVVIYTIVDMLLRSQIAEEIYSFAFTQNKIGTGSALSIIHILYVLAVLGIALLILRGGIKKYE